MALANVPTLSRRCARRNCFSRRLFSVMSLLIARMRSGSPLSSLTRVHRLVTNTGSPASYFNRAVTEAPGNSDYLFNLGYAYALAKDQQAALHWLREAVRYDPANGDAHLVMSALLVGSARTVEAQRELELARLLGTKIESAALTLTEKVPVQMERLRTDLDLPAAPGDAAVVGPAQRDQQDTAAFHLDREQQRREVRAALQDVAMRLLRLDQQRLQVAVSRRQTRVAPCLTDLRNDCVGQDAGRCFARRTYRAVEPELPCVRGRA